MFSVATEIDDVSISIASIAALGNLCAIIRAIIPQPVPMSSMRVGCWYGVANAPNNKASVPTFMVAPESSMENCLKWNKE